MNAKIAVIGVAALAGMASAFSLSMMMPMSEKPHSQREAIERSVAAPLVMEVARDNGAVMTYLNNVTTDVGTVGTGGSGGGSSGVVTYSIASGDSYLSTSGSSGAVMISGGSSGSVTYMAPPKPPRVSISCNDGDTCQVLAYDLNGIGENPEGAMASAKAMLEKIANKQVTMDITVIGHTCQKHHEVIPASKPDLVASKD